MAIFRRLLLNSSIRRHPGREALKWLRYALRGFRRRGYCPICERRTRFYDTGDWGREHSRCIRCHGTARWRAVCHVLDLEFPNWRTLKIHESSPGGGASDKLARCCPGYTASHYFPDVEPGTEHRGFRCENLEALTFAGETFDLVITQDVFEHLLAPERAFAEIARVLKPGGAHLFTIPWHGFPVSRRRAILDGDTIRHLEPPEYHGNPIDNKGSLVTIDWGQDLFDVIARTSGMTTRLVQPDDPHLGLDHPGLQVFISHKPSA